MPVVEEGKQVSLGWDVAKEAFNCVQRATPAPINSIPHHQHPSMQPDSKRTAIHSAQD